MLIHLTFSQEGTTHTAYIGWEEVRVDYGHFTRTSELRRLLICEQKGLCAYCGVALDTRLYAHQPNQPTHSFQAHIEHLKPQSQCKAELEARGAVLGRDLGEDMAYANLVAALEVSGIRTEQFGASHRRDKHLPVKPTERSCEQAFLYLEDGAVVGASHEAQQTIQVLNLDHPTLRAWRRAAIEAWLPLEKASDSSHLQNVISTLQGTALSAYPEFVFVVHQIAKTRLQILEQRSIQGGTAP